MERPRNKRRRRKRRRDILFVCSGTINMTCHEILQYAYTWLHILERGLICHDRSNNINCKLCVKLQSEEIFAEVFLCCLRLDISKEENCKVMSSARASEDWITDSYTGVHVCTFSFYLSCLSGYNDHVYIHGFALYFMLSWDVYYLKLIHYNLIQVGLIFIYN